MKKVFYFLIIIFLTFSCSKKESSGSLTKQINKSEVRTNKEEPAGFKSIHQRDWEEQRKDSLKTKKKVKQKQEVIHYK